MGKLGCLVPRLRTLTRFLIECWLQERSSPTNTTAITRVGQRVIFAGMAAY